MFGKCKCENVLLSKRPNNLFCYCNQAAKIVVDLIFKSAQGATIIFKIQKCLPLSVEDIVVEKPALELCAV